MKHIQGGLFRPQFRRPRFTLAEVAGFVAALAVALRWPILLFPTLGVTLMLLCQRAGLSLVMMMIVASVAGLVVGLVLPPVVTDCRRGVRGTPAVRGQAAPPYAGRLRAPDLPDDEGLPTPPERPRSSGR